MTDQYLEDMELKQIAEHLNEACRIIHERNVRAGWWTDIKTGERKERNMGELLMLVVTEVAEACEGDRKNLMDEHLPTRTSFEVELADVLVRVFDIAGSRKIQLGDAWLEKVHYNAVREDHKIAARLKDDGKKY